MLFFFTPIFYDVAMIPESFRGIYMLNPLSRIMTEFRNLLLYGEIPIISHFLITLLIVGLVYVIGNQIYRTMNPKLVENL